ncbi:uncharacterized protein M6B38_196325 [Iris pallida]|uniref:Uncharacterized protein n=1 Tax=Iris pallida TaxID=29817 RepID=A0AAX6ED14_IRIPA|nr:uncharacterized protein M6B38_196325 [Iris pallida]
MPPSPALRCSPGREQRMESAHKRGRSFESGVSLRAKDDDLALFNDMQNMERDNFLLHDSDDFDDSLSNLRYLSDFKLGVSNSTRGERSDLLNLEGEKNDYDWLLTPPDTPLFRSLDDDDPQPQNLPTRGRPRSQPIRIARSSSMTEKTQMMNRSSASPRRLSPSPRSSPSVTQLKARPSSATHASPPPALRPATPSRRPSTPPNKPSSPTSRSSTPTLLRMSTGSSGQTSSSGRRAASPMNSTRGSSVSPKLRGWHTDLPGFSSDAPPNLRTSLSDWSVPHVRGISPTPGSGRGRGRQSMSPTASRSASSSHSHDQDLISSFSKGSVASSGDDDLDSLHSVAISSSPPVRRKGMSANNRPMTFSKKPSRTSCASSVPKRSLDSVIRQMEHHKTPQNMFRPLLSSVPATTFYVGKANSTHRPMFSRNSSLTTSTSASSEQGASFAPDIEGSEHGHNDLPGERERTEGPDANEELFIFDKADDIVEDCGHEDFAGRPHSASRGFNLNMMSSLDSQECKNFIVQSGATASSATAIELQCATGCHSVVDGCEIMTICSKCGKRFQFVGLNGNTDICEECEKIDQLFTVETFVPVTQNGTVKSDSDMETDGPCNEVQVSGVPESPGKSSGDGQHQRDIQQGPNYLDETCPVQLVTNQSELNLSDHQLDNQPEESAAQSDGGNKLGHMEYTANPSLRVDNPEGAGISVLLLQRSSSRKWPVVQGRTFSATNILCSEPSYVRDNTSSMRRSMGRDSGSASSSMDLGSSRPLEGRIQRQISSRKNEMASMRSDVDAKDQFTDSHPDLLVGTYEPSFQPNSVTEEDFNDSSKSMYYEGLRDSVVDTVEQEKYFDLADASATEFSSGRLDLVDDSVYVKDHSFMVPHTSDSQLPGHLESTHYDSLTAYTLDEPCFSCINADGDPLKAVERNTHDIEVTDDVPDTCVIEEQHVLNNPACLSDTSDSATDSRYVVLESQYGHDSFQDPQTECKPSQIPSTVEVPNEHSVSTTPEKGASNSISESCIIDHAHGIHEESTVVDEGQKGHVPRSFTLAEATDIILFCSSIVHDIAYKAATIGMEELTMPSETTRPTVMIVGKSVLDEKDSRRMPNKHTPKSQKFKRKTLETQTKVPSAEPGKNVIVQGSAPSNAEIPKKPSDSTKPPKLESKCNCTVM